MTLIELKEIIDELAEDETLHHKSVMTAYDYGDHCHTQALNHVGHVQEHHIRMTPYSDSGKALCDKDKAKFEEDTVIAIL
jgi:hypothetical protein